MCAASFQPVMKEICIYFRLVLRERNAVNGNEGYVSSRAALLSLEQEESTLKKYSVVVDEH